jgi:hypothetical protein
MPTRRFAWLGERLFRAGVAPQHVVRVVSELESHFEDLVAEGRASGLTLSESESQAASRLGSDDVIAASILSRPELQSWSRRRPWLAFALLPLISLPVAFVVSMAAAVSAFKLSVHLLGSSWEHPGLTPQICEAIQGFALWVAPALTAGVACLVAARRRAPVVWPIMGCILIALLGAMTNAEFNWSQSQPQGTISAGIGFPGRGPAVGLRLALTLITLVPYLWFKRTAEGRLPN